MAYYCYVIYSKSLNRFYVGSTSDIGQRVEFHNLGYSTYTARARDWKLVLGIECSEKKHALKIERHVKSMKSATYIRNLVLYPEQVEKLKSRCTE